MQEKNRTTSNIQSSRARSQQEHKGTSIIGKKWISIKLRANSLLHVKRWCFPDTWHLPRILSHHTQAGDASVLAQESERRRWPWRGLLEGLWAGEREGRPPFRGNVGIPGMTQDACTVMTQDACTTTLGYSLCAFVIHYAYILLIALF